MAIFGVEADQDRSNPSAVMSTESSASLSINLELNLSKDEADTCMPFLKVNACLLSLFRRARVPAAS